MYYSEEKEWKWCIHLFIAAWFLFCFLEKYMYAEKERTMKKKILPASEWANKKKWCIFVIIGTLFFRRIFADSYNIEIKCVNKWVLQKDKILYFSFFFHGISSRAYCSLLYIWNYFTSVHGILEGIAKLYTFDNDELNL